MSDVTSVLDIINTQQVCFGIVDLILILVAFTVSISIAWCRVKEKLTRNQSSSDQLERQDNRQERISRQLRRSNESLSLERQPSEEN